MAPDDKNIAIDRGPCHNALGQHERKALAVALRRCPCRIAGPREDRTDWPSLKIPAPDADGETLGNQPRTKGSADDQDLGMQRIRLVSPQRKQRSDQKSHKRQKPDFSATQRMEKRGCHVVVSWITFCHPGERKYAVLYPIPGQKKKTCPPNDQPKQQRWVGKCLLV